MMGIDKKNTLLYGLTVVILVSGLAVLLYLERRVVSDRRAAIDNAKDLLGKERILKAKDDVRISFSAIETLARSIKKSPFIKEIFVSKILSGRGEHIVYPFYYTALATGRRPNLSGLRREALIDGGETLGYIYINLNNRIITGVRVATASFAIFLVLTLASFYARVHTQERVISATTIELEEKRRELIRLERLALAGQLSANILHDIKKPILNIKQEAAELEENVAGAESHKAVQNIRQQVKLFFNILHELGLERFVKAGEGGEEYVDINEILERACQLVRYERGGIEVRRNFAKDLPLIFAHPYKLIQLFSNLILNAYQAMGGKGKLILKTAYNEKYLTIEIADTGRGIPPEAIPHLFTPFFTARKESESGEEGTGLGLYISKNIVDELGGEISVKSVHGSGTTFNISLPVSEKSED